MSHPRRQRGVTLIELMIGLIILGVLIALTVPAFVDARQRASLRGAAEQVASFWADARFEALRRNANVRVTLRSNAEGEMCLGANVVPPTTSDTCDCFVESGAGLCNVARWPESQGDWRAVRPNGNPTLGTPDTDLLGEAILDPKRGNLTDPAHAGVFPLMSPEGGRSEYRLNVAFDRNGRAFICEPAAAPDKLPQYANRRC